jgi:hypothetical protein
VHRINDSTVSGPTGSGARHGVTDFGPAKFELNQRDLGQLERVVLTANLSGAVPVIVNVPAWTAWW